MIEFSGPSWYETSSTVYQRSIDVIEPAERVESVAEKKARKAREAKAVRVPFGFIRELTVEGE